MQRSKPLDFGLSPEQERFRQDVRSLSGEGGTPGAGGGLRGRGRRAVPVCPEHRPKSWPSGAGWWLAGPKSTAAPAKTQIEHAILSEELGYRRAPSTGNVGRGYVGPAIMEFGTAEQKETYLPPIANAEVQYCQGFSEPNAGSDLAGLELRAARDGDEYVLSGSKMFTSYAYHADYIYLLARTDPEAPRHRGISLFIVDVDTPGVSFRPLPYINGDVAAQTYFDDVRVPASCLIGEENQGWYHAMTTLDYERSGLERYAGVRRTFDDFVEYCNTSPTPGQPDRRMLQHRLAEIRVGMEAWRLLCWHVAWLQSTGAVPNAEASEALPVRDRAAPTLLGDGDGGAGPLRRPGQRLGVGPTAGRHRGNLQGEYAPARRRHLRNTPQHHRPEGSGPASLESDMDLGLNERQQLLRSTAREFLQAECPISLVRETESGDRGYSEALWRKMAGLGWLGLALPAEHGGSGGDAADLVVLAEEMGRALVPGPFITSSVLCGRDAGPGRQLGPERVGACWHLPGRADCGSRRGLARPGLGDRRGGRRLLRSRRQRELRALRGGRRLLRGRSNPGLR